MKTQLRLLICLAAVLTAGPAFAQTISGGGKAGLSVANLSNPTEFDTKTKSGFAAGGFVNVGVNDMFSVQPEVLFVQKGAKLDEAGFDASVNLDYIDIPILGVFSFETGGSVEPFVYAGPSFGINTSAKAEFEGEEEDIDDDVKGSNVAIVFGGGVKIGGVTIEARYDAGVTNIADGVGADDEDIKTRTFMVLVGFGLPN